MLERRLPPAERGREAQKTGMKVTGLPLPIWRCRVCDYVCAREQAPEACPICEAKKDRFEQFI